MNNCKCAERCNNWWCGLSCKQALDIAFLSYLQDSITEDEYINIKLYLEDYARLHSNNGSGMVDIKWVQRRADSSCSW